MRSTGQGLEAVFAPRCSESPSLRVEIACYRLAGFVPKHAGRPAPAAGHRPHTRQERRCEGDEVQEVIHWLHLSDADVAKARGIINAFKEDDTVDALGFQRISERFDDWFYPGVTTPMTRARFEPATFGL